MSNAQTTKKERNRTTVSNNKTNERFKMELLGKQV